MKYPGMSTDAQPPVIQVTKFSLSGRYRLWVPVWRLLST